MIIYELIYYWDDIYDGATLSNTILLTEIDEVNKEIEKFKNQERQPSTLFDETIDDSYKSRLITYDYGIDVGLSNLVIRMHNI